MSTITSSLPQAETYVNIQVVELNKRVKAAAAARTPEQIQADNEHTAKLRAQDAVLLAGPVEAGPVINVPSWRWNPELVRALHQFRGAHFEKELPYTVEVIVSHHVYSPTITMSTWTVPAAPGRLEAVRAIYERAFCQEMAMARMIQRMCG